MAYVLILEHSFVKVLEQMSVINFMNYFLSTAAEGFVPSHAPLKNNKHVNIPFQSTQPRRGKNKSELQGLTPSSQVWAFGMRRGAWGHASILSVTPNAAPDRRRLLRVLWTAGRSNQSILKEISWVFIRRTDVEAETPILWPPDVKSWLTGKAPDVGKD